MHTEREQWLGRSGPARFVLCVRFVWTTETNCSCSDAIVSCCNALIPGPVPIQSIQCLFIATSNSSTFPAGCSNVKLACSLVMVSVEGGLGRFDGNANAETPDEHA